MDDDGEDQVAGVPRAARTMATIAVLCLMAALIILAIDFRLKAQILTAANLARGTGNAPGDRRPRPAAPGAGPAVPGREPGVQPVGPVVDPAGTQEDGGAHAAAEVVRAGDER